MKKLFKGFIVIFIFLCLLSVLNNSLPDETKTQIGTIWEDVTNSIPEIFEKIKDGISTVYNSVVNEIESSKNFNTEVGEISVDQLPEEAQEYYNRYKNDNWETTSNDLEGKTHAGDDYDNMPREAGATKLPEETPDGAKITYKEFDAETTPAGARRGAKRFVHGSDGSTYYTDDHYYTFKKIIN